MNWDFTYRGETEALDDLARRGAAGSFARLPQGVTHYELAGPQDAQAIVLVHGFSVPYFIWDQTFEALTAAGRRVLRYDLFGRGYSDRVQARYTIDFFVQQLAGLLDALHITRVDLVGLSMGGAIASAFTVQFAERVDRLVLIDPIGTQPMPLSLFYKAALLPGISEVILNASGTERMVRALASDFFDPAEVKRFQERYRAQMKFRGFRRAIVSTLRSGAVDGVPEVYRRLGRLDVPVLLIWGRQDQTLPIEQSEPIRKLVPRAEFRIVEDAGHVPHCERPEVVNPILLGFLSAE